MKRVKEQPEAVRRMGRLKSQYPADSTERHVEYILVASFHVDRGPVMEHQYPGAISGDENMLAELMLPDQAHVRKQDWTIFFLHKDTSEEDDKEEEAKGDTNEGHTFNGNAEGAEGQAESHADQQTDTSKDQEEMEGGEGPPLIYVLNLVNTKQDTSVKRLLPAQYASCDHDLTGRLQRRSCQGYGHLYKTFLSSHIQGT